MGNFIWKSKYSKLDDSKIKDGARNSSKEIFRSKMINFAQKKCHAGMAQKSHFYIKIDNGDEENEKKQLNTLNAIKSTTEKMPLNITNEIESKPEEMSLNITKETESTIEEMSLNITNEIERRPEEISLNITNEIQIEPEEKILNTTNRSGSSKDGLKTENELKVIFEDLLSIIYREDVFENECKPMAKDGVLDRIDETIVNIDQLLHKLNFNNCRNILETDFGDCWRVRYKSLQCLCGGIQCDPDFFRPLGFKSDEYNSGTICPPPSPTLNRHPTIKDCNVLKNSPIAIAIGINSLSESNRHFYSRK